MGMEFGGDMKKIIQLVVAVMVIGSFGISEATAATGNASKGRKTWNKNCQSCHTESSKEGMTSKKLSRALRNEPSMASLKGKIKSKDILNLVAYVRKANK